MNILISIQLMEISSTPKPIDKSDMTGEGFNTKVEIWDEVRYEIQNLGVPSQLRLGLQSFHYCFQQAIAITMGHFQQVDI